MSPSRYPLLKLESTLPASTRNSYRYATIFSQSDIISCTLKITNTNVNPIVSNTLTITRFGTQMSLTYTIKVQLRIVH